MSKEKFHWYAFNTIAYNTKQVVYKGLSRRTVTLKVIEHVKKETKAFKENNKIKLQFVHIDNIIYLGYMTRETFEEGVDLSQI